MVNTTNSSHILNCRSSEDSALGNSGTIIRIDSNLRIATIFAFAYVQHSDNTLV